MTKKIILTLLLGMLPFLISPAFADSDLLGYNHNKNFAEDIQPKLLEKLQAPETTLLDFKQICIRLSVFGDADAVPVIAEKLGDRERSHSARTALQEMPCEEAVAALRDAMKTVSDATLKAGIIDSLGQRRDLKAVPMLLPLLNDGNKEIVLAAAFALARIADPAYMDELGSKMNSEMSEKLTEACLIYGEILRKDGKNADAERAFQKVVDAQPKKPHQLQAAYFQLLLCSRPETYNRLAAWLVSEDDLQFQAAIRATHFLKNADATNVMVRVFENVSLERQVMILAALGDQKTREAIPLITKTLGSENPDLQAAAIGAAKNSVGAAGFQMLLKTALSVEGTLQKETLRTMAFLPDNMDQDTEILKSLNTDNQTQKLLVTELIGLRRMTEALPTIRGFLKDGGTPEALKIEAQKALGEIGTLDDLKEQMAFLLTLPKDSPRAEAVKTCLYSLCARMTDRPTAVGIVAGGIAEAKNNPDVQLYFFQLLPALDSDAAIQVISRFAESDDVQMQDFATNAMGRWRSTRVGLPLLKLANNKDHRYANRALRGYLRLARQFAMPEIMRTNMVKNALASPVLTDSEKEIADIIVKQYNLRLDGDMSALCPVQIVSARYGAQDFWVDVTDKVLEYFDGSYVLSLPKYNDIFGDPINGTVKTLQMELRYPDGSTKDITYNENDRVVIPEK